MNITRSVLFAVLAASSLSAQVMTVPPGPAAPGSLVTVSIFNNLPTAIGASYFVWLLDKSGGYVAPRDLGCSDAGFQIPPAGTWMPGLTMPATGPGSVGSHVLYYPIGNGAVGRVDVGSASTSFPAIHAFPRWISYQNSAHAVSFVAPGSTPWALANTSASSFTFGAGDALRIFAPGAVVPAASMPLAGVAVGPGAVTSLTLPLASLAPGPYTVEVSWTDPIAGPSVRRTGIRDNRGADLHLPAGKVVPVGGALEVFLSMQLLAPPVGTPIHALAVGSQSASFALPTGARVPLAVEPLVIESLNSGVFGLLVNNVGTPMATGGLWCPDRFRSDGLFITHPNLPALANTRLYLAAVMTDSTNSFWAATQGEEIVLQ